MALKGNWKDKINGVDKNNADDINQVAHAVIELESVDWMATSSGSDDYETILPETKADKNMFEGIAIKMNLGLTYCVYYYGVLYECVAYNLDGATTLGNASILE